MAVVTVKSTVITNRDATPKTVNNAHLAQSPIRETSGVCAIANGDSVNSKYIFCSVPSNAKMSELRVKAPDIGTTTTGHFGLYKTTEDGGAVVDADFFKATQSLKDGAIDTDLVAGNVLSVANHEKRLWDALGLSSDPNIWYDIVLTLDGAADAAGSVSVQAKYTV